jgi:hypothetical protein
MKKYFLFFLFFSTSMVQALEVGLFHSNYEYLEPNLMKISGDLVGVEASQNIDFEKDYFFNVSGKFSKSKVNYLSFNTGAEVNGVVDYINDVSLSFGKKILFDNIAITPSIGQGTYQIKDLLNSTGIANSLSQAGISGHEK